MTPAPLDMSTVVPLTERWAVAGNHPIFYRAALHAAPVGTLPIIHLHGFGISGRYLVPTAERLAPFHPTYVPDMPGYGRSPRPNHPLTIPELALKVIAFMDALGIERACLMGNSMGCLVTMECAIRFPHRIQRAIMVSPAGGAHNQPLLRGIAQLGVDSLRESRGLLQIAVPDYLRFGIINSIRLFRDMAIFATSERAIELDSPALVIIGGRDPLVSRSRLQKLVSDQPNMTMVIQDRAAHAINFSHPRSLARVVRAWLADDPLPIPASELEHTMILGDELDRTR
jgi:pimeloyl-ACP methyl ester carboxylesterase